MDGLQKKNRQYVVFSCPEMDWLRQDLAARKPQWFVPGSIDFKYFPDGTPNIFIHDIDKISNRHVLFLASFHDYRSKYSCISTIYVLTRSMVRTLTVSLPFIDTATMERVDREGVVATADVDAWMLSSLPQVNGPTTFIVYDLHTLQNRFYFHNGALLKMATGVNLLKEKLDQINDHEWTMAPTEYLDNFDGITTEWVICFPDAGSEKRFGNQFKEYPTIVCKKVREGDQRYVAIDSGDAKGRHVVIVDDLVQTGGTLLETREALVKAGALKVSAYATHAIFPNESWKRMVGKFEHFFTTNSHPNSQQLKDVKPFWILSIASDLTGHLLADPDA